MKYLKPLIIVLAIIILIFVLVRTSGKYILPALYGPSQTENTGTASVDEKLLNKKAPFFDLPTPLDARVKLSQFLDAPVILVFWSTWNQDSLNQVKIVDDYLSAQTDRKLVSFLAINSQEEPSIVKSYVRRGGYTVPFALDSYGDISENYHVKSLPVLYFIDREGIIREIYSGVLSQSMIVSKIEQLLKG